LIGMGFLFQRIEISIMDVDNFIDIEI